MGRPRRGTRRFRDIFVPLSFFRLEIHLRDFPLFSYQRCFLCRYTSQSLFLVSLMGKARLVASATPVEQRFQSQPRVMRSSSVAEKRVGSPSWQVQITTTAMMITVTSRVVSIILPLFLHAPSSSSLSLLSPTSIASIYCRANRISPFLANGEGSSACYCCCL